MSLRPGLRLCDALFVAGYNPAACSVTITAGAGDTFQCYAVEDPITATLDGGNLPGEWEATERTLGLQWFETWESYADEDPITATLDGGTPFLAAVPAGEWEGT